MHCFDQREQSVARSDIATKGRNKGTKEYLIKQMLKLGQAEATHLEPTLTEQ
jgi:hypothetical protein